MKAIFFLLLPIIFSSCAENDDNNFIGTRHSFIKIVHEENVKICNDGKCVQKTFKSVSSGAVVLYRGNEDTVLTAAHSCMHSKPTALNDVVDGTIEIKTSIFGYDTDNLKHILEVKKVDEDNDLCLLVADTLSSPALELSKKEPPLDGIYYNFAAPHGIFAANMIPMFSGHFSGEYENMAAYTIPAKQGSSGSPIVNKNGKLVGMIHSVHNQFENFSLSATYSAIKNFLEVEDEEEDQNPIFWNISL
tara:strand:+ start:4509 stop:5249 length:741 start_codon:yes stop_codon:yes gene_type:complete